VSLNPPNFSTARSAWFAFDCINKDACLQPSLTLTISTD
jgi:hypothetical protein